MNTHEKVIMSAIIYLSHPPAETNNYSANKTFKQKSQIYKEGEAKVGGDGQKEEIWEGTCNSINIKNI